MIYCCFLIMKCSGLQCLQYFQVDTSNLINVAVLLACSDQKLIINEGIQYISCHKEHIKQPPHSKAFKS